jgi:hypothetical protein
MVGHSPFLLRFVPVYVVNERAVCVGAQQLEPFDGAPRKRANARPYSDAERIRIRGVYMATRLKGGVLARSARKLAAELGRTDYAILQQFKRWNGAPLEGAPLAQATGDKAEVGGILTFRDMPVAGACDASCTVGQESGTQPSASGRSDLLTSFAAVMSE